MLSAIPAGQAQDPAQARAAMLKSAWRELRPRATGPVFTEEPLVTPPYRAGKLSEAHLQDALNQVRFVRRVAGVPDDVGLDPELTASAQHGAVLLARLNSLDHDPARPGDMATDFFDRAKRACGSSNLALGPTKPADAIHLFMGDTGVSSLGHRRWILNWRMGKTGFGFAKNRVPVTLMAVFDASRPKADVAAFTAWPAPTAFPIEWFDAQMDWSVDLAPAYFEPPDPVRLRVTAVRERDNQRWVFRLGAGLRVTPDGFGNGRGVAFRVPTSPKADESWRVALEGLRRRDGTLSNLYYTTRFFRLN